MIVFFKFPLVDTLGGAEFHTLKLAKYFQSAGKEVRLFTSDKKLLKLFEDNTLPAQYMFAGWEPTSIWSLLLWPATYLIARQKFQKLMKQIPPGSMIFMQSLIEKLVLTPVLQGGEKVGVWLEHKIPGRWLKLNPLRQRFLELSKLVRLVTVSNFSKKEFIKLGVQEKNIQAVYPGTIIFPPPKGKGEKKEGVRKITIGLLSRLDPEKGVYAFLGNILPHLPNHSDWKILIAGEGREKQKIINIINKYNLNNQIFLLGFVNDLDVFFSKITVLAYPTNVPESFGIAVLEALAHGIPVVASNLGALPEIIEHGKNGFLVHVSPPPRIKYGTGSNGNHSLPWMGRAREGWIESLELLKDPELYRKLSDNACVSAQNFSQEKMFSAFQSLDQQGGLKKIQWLL